MVKSMTGFGRHREILHGREITVEVKSVNARYFEYYSKLPRSLAFLDDALKKAVGAVVQRGKTELHLSVQTLEDAGLEIGANLPVAQGYYDALQAIGESLGIANDVKASHFLRLSDVFSLRRREEDEGELSADVLLVAGGALERFSAMRAVEGQKLAEDVAARLDTIEALVAQVDAESEGRTARYTEKLAARLEEILADTTVDEGR
ncbi:MAG: YicC/YloC family endoribonuclease, partial [Oscillospiraceae bacterium]